MYARYVKPEVHVTGNTKFYFFFLFTDVFQTLASNFFFISVMILQKILENIFRSRNLCLYFFFIAYSVLLQSTKKKFYNLMTSLQFKTLSVITLSVKKNFQIPPSRSSSSFYCSSYCYCFFLKQQKMKREREREREVGGLIISFPQCFNLRFIFTKYGVLRTPTATAAEATWRQN